MPSATQGRREITLLQERSAGTFAQVYLARSTDAGGLSRIVAVKVLRERWIDTQDILDRTRDEAQLLASLQHQHIVRVDAITEIEGRPAIIMEFVHGLDLGQLMKALDDRNAVIPPRAIYEIGEAIASALAAAWFKVPIGMAAPLRVVHRDIKPSNVMISTEGDLRVLDFGTARFEDVQRRATTQMFRFGSVKYMSPERREGSRGDHTSDLYSLGLVLIELLGRRFKDPVPMADGAHDGAIEMLIDTIPDFGLPNAGWDNSLRETLMRLCASDVENRLDARQTVKLMRAFKEQASGDGLVAFAEEVVSTLTKPMATFPEATQSDAEVRGAQFALEPDGRTSVLRRGAGLPDIAPSATPNTEGMQAELPTMLAKDAVPFDPRPMGTEDLPTQTDTNQSGNLRPGYAMQENPVSSPSQRDDDSSNWMPKEQRREPAPSPAQTPGKPKRLPPPMATQPTAKARNVGIGCAVAMVLFVVLVGASWLAWIMIHQPSSTQVEISTDAPETPVQATNSTDVSVELHAGDPTVQWVRLENESGERILTARPDGTAQIAAGDYKLSVKVIARSKLEGPISFTEDTNLNCKPATMGRIRCSDSNGKTRIILLP
jgi:serine/threonine protein kinase